MVPMRRTLVTAVLTMLTVVTCGVLVQPAAWAAPEFKISLSHEQVTTVRERIAQGDTACDVIGLGVGAAVSVGTAGAPVVAGTAIGTAVGATGMLCGGNDQQLRAAVDEAYFKKCGVDAYFTDGPLSFDTNYRYVVCP